MADSAKRFYCRTCSYDLSETGEPYRCPECGRGFDPADARTVRKRPRGLWKAVAIRLALAVLAFALVGGSYLGWIGWGWRREQAVARELNITSAQWLYVAPPAVMRAFGAERLTWFRRLEVVNGFDKTAGPERLGRLAELRWLAMLDAADSKMDGPTLGRIAGACPLTLLNVARTRVDDPGLAGLAESRGAEQLRVLSVEGCSIGDAGARHIGRLKNLESLTLAGTTVTDSGVAQLTDLERLVSLDLSGTAITDAGLAALEGLPALERLSVERTKISAAGFASLRRMRALKWVFLAGTETTEEQRRGFYGEMGAAIGEGVGMGEASRP